MDQFHVSQIMPARVSAAFQFLDYSRRICDSDDHNTGRDMSRSENEVYESALTVVQNYLEGTDTLEPVLLTPVPPDDEPEDPEQVPVQ